MWVKFVLTQFVGQVHVGQVPVTRHGVMVTAIYCCFNFKAITFCLVWLILPLSFPPRGVQQQGVLPWSPSAAVAETPPGLLGFAAERKFLETFWPEWDDTYPELDTDKLQQELADEEKAFQEETAHIDKHRIFPPMKSSLFRVFMTRHVLGYASEVSVLRFPSSWRGWNH
jgi:hypothetical protein